MFEKGNSLQITVVNKYTVFNMWVLFRERNVIVWLVDCQNGKSGAFAGWTALLLTDSKREDGFRRLLEAGGATVIPDKYATALFIICLFFFLFPTYLSII